MMYNPEDVQHIQEVVTQVAEQARDNAGYAGSHGDGGASHQEECLRVWLDGINFAMTGKTQLYKEILKKRDLGRDPDYSQYLLLKARFEGK